MMSDDFDWHGSDARSVVLPEQPMTAVYATSGSQIVLRQQAAAGYQDEDALAYFNPQGALAVAMALIRHARIAGLPPLPQSAGNENLCDSEHDAQEGA